MRRARDGVFFVPSTPSRILRIFKSVSSRTAFFRLETALSKLALIPAYANRSQVKKVLEWVSFGPRHQLLFREESEISSAKESMSELIPNCDMGIHVRMPKS